MDLRVPPLKIKNLLESNPLKSRCVVRGLTVGGTRKRSGGSFAVFLGTRGPHSLNFCGVVVFHCLANYGKRLGSFLVPLREGGIGKRVPRTYLSRRRNLEAGESLRI